MYGIRLYDEIKQRFENMTPEELAAYEKEVAQHELEQTRREAMDRYQSSGVPERYWAESLDTYHIKNDMQKAAATSAANFIKATQNGQFKSLAMIGNAGTGKTHLACAIVREAGGKYRTAPDIVEELRRAKSFTASETEADIIRYYSRLPLLVIDEIGRGIAAADEKYMLYMILNARYNTRRPSVLISNLNKSEFLQYIGVAAADRLVESADIVEMNGQSYRRELRGNGN